ncbi:MAG TPA: PQQ-binding-like beta-propeller repeat protein, partial [Candidatus Nitrosotenuis sp.]|nr:PQQ-binding-like beta-propeller repeat protein [Candidatus Nitrosotenuis sp.]
MKRIFSAIAIGLLFCAAAQAQHWPQFRGPAASGVADGHPTAAQWNAEKNENILWKAPIPGLSVASPIVWGERVFVTTAISSDPSAKFRHGLYGDVEPSPDVTPHTWKVYALDKRTGKIIWEAVSHTGVPKTKRHPKSSQNNSTPATDGKHVVVFFGSEGLYTYDWNGKLLRKKDLGPLNAGWFYDPDYEWGSASSPILWRNMVIVQCDIQENSFIAAFDIKSGKELWRTMRDEIPSWGTPTVVESKTRAELVTHATKFIRGYDPLTGKELWRLAPNSEVTAPTPFAAHDLIFVTNGYRGIQPIYAIRPGASGDISLKGGATSSEAIAWSAPRGGPYMPTPVVYGDYLYVCANNGVLTVYEAKTGTRVYQQRLGGTGGAFSASPVAADGKIYFTSEDGDVFVVKAGPQYELLSKNPMGEVLMATPAISDGIL